MIYVARRNVLKHQKGAEKGNDKKKCIDKNKKCAGKQK